jgi:hypothetical protein
MAPATLSVHAVFAIKFWTHFAKSLREFRKSRPAEKPLARTKALPVNHQMHGISFVFQIPLAACVIPLIRPCETCRKCRKHSMQATARSYYCN